MPASSCLSTFSLSAVGNYADECENAESRLVFLGQTVDKAINQRQGAESKNALRALRFCIG